MTRRSSLTRFCAVTLVALVAGACAQKIETSKNVVHVPDLELSLAVAASVSKDGVAMNGYDPVHMLETDGAIAIGSGEYVATHEGATYLFKTARNRETFKQNPARYAPKYSGFCGWGMVDYRDVTTDKPVNIPHATPTPSISDGGVYVVWGEGDTARIMGFYNRKAYERFLVDPDMYEATADKTWAERRADALVPWEAVAEEMKTLRRKQTAER